MARNLFNTGNDKTTIADTEKLAAGSGAANAFNITFLAFKKLFSGLWFGGVEMVEAVSEGLSVNSGDLNTDIDVTASSRSRVTLDATGVGGKSYAAQSGLNGEYWIVNRTDATIPLKLINDNAVFSGTVTAAGFIPFTGCHIAKSNEDLKLGELVQIKSVGWVNPKQPDWLAEYCNESKKGIYGVVYGTQINKDEETQYLIAAVGDGFIEVDCACEYGDVLIPSETKGLATVYKGDYLPLNMVGFAGEDSEGGKISWTKE